MKIKCFFLRFVIFLVIISISVSLNSQVIDKHPDRNNPHERFSETTYAQQQPVRDNIPLITAMVGAVSADTLRNTLRQLQNWGSRFMLNDNHKDVATWLMNKFRSYGYTDVKLDSFYNTNPNFYTDSTWQFNVVCTLPGASAPEEIYVIGGHYDSYSTTNPYTTAPGVDDNGSATAATLETARVMARMNFHPETTIRFVLFAAEELGLFGSGFDAHKAHMEGRDIRLMYNMDMVANDPDNLNELIGNWYPGHKWISLAVAAAIERYTDISVIVYNETIEGTDSYSYYTEGFPAFDCVENEFSPYYHSPADTVGNYNVFYLAQVTGGAIATLAEQQLFPTPQEVIAHSNKVDVTLQWKPTNNAFVQGVNVYRSVTTGSQYQKITSSPVSGNIYHDSNVEPNLQYYYVLTTVNDSLQESGFSQEVTGALFNFSDSLLVVANLKGTLTTPDNVFGFYKAVLDTIPFVWYDANATQKVDLGLLSRYHSILLMTNTTAFEVQDTNLIMGISEYIANGGNVLFAGFSPMKFWMNGATYPVKTPETSLFRRLFKVDTVDRKPQCMMFRANAVAFNYDTLTIDSLKYLTVNFPGQINTVEVFSPAPDANLIYRLDSKYDSTTILGIMKHRPVGLEYMRNDFKSILLSFPLYYIDTTDARKFLHYVMTEKFNHPVGIRPTDPVDPFSLKIYPNPVSDVCNVTFSLPQSGHVKLMLVSMQGQLLNTWIDNYLEKGNHSLIEILPKASGLYQVVLQTTEDRTVRKIVKLR
jgi:hypothetical protein